MPFTWDFTKRGPVVTPWEERHATSPTEQRYDNDTNPVVRVLKFKQSDYFTADGSIIDNTLLAMSILGFSAYYSVGQTTLNRRLPMVDPQQYFLAGNAETSQPPTQPKGIIPRVASEILMVRGIKPTGHSVYFDPYNPVTGLSPKDITDQVFREWEYSVKYSQPNFRIQYDNYVPSEGSNFKEQYRFVEIQRTKNTEYYRENPQSFVLCAEPAAPGGGTPAGAVTPLPPTGVPSPIAVPWNPTNPDGTTNFQPAFNGNAQVPEGLGRINPTGEIQVVLKDWPLQAVPTALYETAAGTTNSLTLKIGWYEIPYYYANNPAGFNVRVPMVFMPTTLLFRGETLSKPKAFPDGSPKVDVTLRFGYRPQGGWTRFPQTADGSLRVAVRKSNTSLGFVPLTDHRLLFQGNQVTLPLE